jgi:hypothetical protein
MHDKSAGQRWHRITHRLLSEFQHRCMVRPAAEEWNLAANWHPHDVKNAEFLRTYRSLDFPGGLLVRRLEAETSTSEKRKCLKAVPPVGGTAPTSEVFLRQFDDLYGYRGDNENIYYLNPWEFLMLWETLPLPKPSQSRREDGKDGVDDAEEPEDDRSHVPLTLKMVRPEPDSDRDYDVNPEAETNDVRFFPEDLPGDVQLRWRWYMRRRRRPMVPAPTNTPMPDKQGSSEGKARLFSLYLRPWVLDGRFATEAVPHLSQLDRVTRWRLRCKQVVTMPRRSYSEAWRCYVRGHVVSEHAKRIIVQFMAACCGKSKSGRESTEDLGDDSAKVHELPANEVPLGRVHDILDRMSRQEDDAPRSRKADAEEGVEDDENVDEKALRQSTQVRGSMQMTAKLWSRDDNRWPEEPVDTRDSSLRTTPPDATRRSRRSKTKDKNKPCPKAQQARAYLEWKETNVTTWLETVRAGADAPTPEQDAFLQRVVSRCREEHAEQTRASGSRARREKSSSEPVLDCLFGIPGAGKSTCLKLVRRFFEECLGWQDGVQFQYLATQNTMAALIGGATIQHWGCVPVNATEAAAKLSAKASDGDIDQLFLNAIGIRWLLIDEVSTASPYLLGLLDAYLSRACARHPYARRRNGSKRPFGGINMGLAGDLWQLPPVRASAIFSNPYKKGYSFQEQKIFKMFWKKTEDSIQQTFLLTRSMRTGMTANTQT